MVFSTGGYEQRNFYMIVVFGSLNADFFLKVKNFPQPGETILTPGAVIKPGGKGANQAVAAARSGASVMMVGAVGNDELAKVPLNALQAAGVDCSLMQTAPYATAIAMIMVDEKGENSIVVASGANGAVTADRVPDNIFNKDTILVMQMEVPLEQNVAVMMKAKARGAKVVLNVAPAYPLDEKILPLVDYLILNQIESEMIYRHIFKKPSRDIEDLVLKLSGKTGHACLITLGKNGVIVAENREVTRATSLSITPLDTTGAGDAFVGIFSSALDQKSTLAEALRYASAGAGLACLQMGAQEALPSLAEIKQKMGAIKIF